MSEQETRVEVGDVWRYAHDGANYTIVRRHEDGHSWRFGDGRGDHFSDGAFGHIGPFGLMLISRRAPEAKHPERKPGQRWRAQRGGKYPLTVTGTLTCQDRDGWTLKDVQRSDDWTGDSGFNDSYWLPGSAWTMALLSTPAEPSARGVDRSGCKAWCGLKSMDDTVPAGLGGNNGPGWFTDSFGHGRPAGEAIRAWCSEACRRDRVPPLSAQGDGPKCRVCSDRHIAPLCNGKCFECFRTKITGPAPAAKHAETVRVPRVCAWHIKHECGPTFKRHTSVGLLSFCHNGAVAHEQEIASLMMFETTGGSDVLHNDKVPERLSKPRLAHSYGVEDPALEDVR